LLLGSVLLFGVLAGAMIVTRRFDWYAVGARIPAAPGIGGDPSTPTNSDS
jgi:inner membrane protein